MEGRIMVRKKVRKVRVMSRDFIFWACLIMMVLGVGMIIYKANYVDLWNVNKKFEVRCVCPENHVELLETHGGIVIGCLNLSPIRKDSSVVGFDFSIVDSVCD